MKEDIFLTKNMREAFGNIYDNGLQGSEFRNNKVTGICVHTMDSDVKAHDHSNGLVHLRKWHVAERDFDDIGYHFFIASDGCVYCCRPLSESGAHCRGINTTHIGVCLWGKSSATVEQLESLEILSLALKKYSFPNINEVCQHSKYDKKKPFCAGLTEETVAELQECITT